MILRLQGTEPMTSSFEILDANRLTSADFLRFPGPATPVGVTFACESKCSSLMLASQSRIGCVLVDRSNRGVIDIPENRRA